MKLQSILFLLVSVACLNVAAQEKTGNLKGVQYTIFTPNEGPKIKVNDVITFNFIQKTDKDSVLMSSYQRGRPVQVQVTESKNIADLMGIFTLLGANDSVLAKVPTDSIFKNAEAQRPPFLPKGSLLHFIIKVDSVQNLDQVIAAKKLEMAKMESQEKDALNKYVAENNLNPQTTASGLKYIITQGSTNSKPQSGDTVLVNYIGRTLEGKVFDSSIEEEAKKAGLEQPGRKYEPINVVLGEGQVIRGWDEGLVLLNEGSKAKFIIPSSLGYGSAGAGADIKPFSALVFDVELVKVKPAKQLPKPVPAVAKKTPVKAASAKSSSIKKKPATAIKKSVPVKK